MAGREAAAGEEPGYSPEALLRRKSFEECSAADLEAMERLMDLLARRLATRPSRRRVPVHGAAHGEADLRRSFRRAVAHGGEFLSLARRRRAVERPRLVVLCDTSGSMDPHTRFLLGFVLALRRVARHSELFAFNTALVRLTPWLRSARSARSAGPATAGGNLADAEQALRRLAEEVPGWSGGTRIGECLAEFADSWLDELVDGRTVVVIFCDGLDRGDVAPLAGAMRTIRARARRVVWLNPLAGDRRYEPTARAMAAAMPHVDRLLPAHNLEALERLLPLLSA
ncbi:MAG TPA: VWA domain-containing protein [Thermoanaerobaculia bacterium]|nr:VWA domain-containing protein [Thermoanaerobaculia bacterium]